MDADGVASRWIPRPQSAHPPRRNRASQCREMTPWPPEGRAAWDPSLETEGFAAGSRWLSEATPPVTDPPPPSAPGRGASPVPPPGAGIPAGMPGFTLARVPVGVVASLLDHRLQAGKPPASWQMDAEVTWDVATRAHAAVAHPPRRRVGTQPAATCPLGDREPPSSLRADLGPSCFAAYGRCHGKPSRCVSTCMRVIRPQRRRDAEFLLKPPRLRRRFPPHAG